MSNFKESSFDNQNGENDSYVGYQPLTDYDLNALQNKYHQELTTFQSVQKPRLLKSTILTIIFFISFWFLFVWQMLIVRCRVTNLCELVDLSSQTDTPYLFRTFSFRIFSSMVWLGLTFGSFIFFLCSISTLHLARKPVTSKGLVYIGYYIRQAASHILLRQYFVIVIPAFVLFIIFGLTINWSIAGSFSLGAMMCILLGNVATSICAKANVRISTGSTFLTFSESFNVASYAASVLFLSTIGLVVFTVATVYLFYSDIQALAGFITGSSFTALVLRTSSTLSFDAMVSGFNFKPLFREVLPPNIVAMVALGISVIGGFLTDIFSTFALCIIATGILGSGLPYYSHNQFALCMFNHLNIDRICGTFGYPQELSFASLLCRSDSMYLMYPSVKHSASASVFVAVPFILITATIAVNTISSMIVYFSSSVPHEQKETEKTQGISLISNSTFKFSSIIVFLQIISSCAIFFGLFGPWSLFQKSDGTGFGKLVPRMVLDGSPQQCVPSLSLLPQGLTLTEDRYRPLSISGAEFGSVEGVASRLFFCNFVGVIAGVAVLLLSLSPNMYRNSNKPSVGTLAILFGNCSVGILIHISVSIVILLTILVSHRLNGPYGVGVAAIGYLSSSSGSYIFKLIGIILMNARNSEISSRNLPGSSRIRDAILDLSRVSAIGSQIVSNGAVTLSAVVGIFAIIQQAGIWPSPRDLVGSVDLPPSLPISSVNKMSFNNISIIVGIMLGATMPLLVGAISISGTFRSALAIYVERRKQGNLSVSSSSSLVVQIVIIAFQECSIIPIISVLLPLCVGFGFGHRTLVSTLAGLVGAGYGIGTALPGGLDTKEYLVPYGEGDIVKSVKESVGPSLQVATKLSVAMALAMSTLMRPENGIRWLGYVLLVIMIICFVSIAFWRQHRFSELIEISGSRDNPETWEAPARKVSPFYEEGNKMEPQRIGPSSAMGETMRHFGQCRTPLTPEQVGLRHGTVWTTNASDNQGDVVVLRPQVPLTRSIMRDDARDVRNSSE